MVPFPDIVNVETFMWQIKKTGLQQERRRYFYFARVTPTVTKTDILRGPRYKKKHDNNGRNIKIC